MTNLLLAPVRPLAIWITVLLATLSMSVAAREAAPAVAAHPAPIARPALWKVSDRDTTIYLFGPAPRMK